MRPCLKEKNGEREGRGERRRRKNRTQGSNSNSTAHSSARSRPHTHLQASLHYQKKQGPKCSGRFAKGYMLYTSLKFLATFLIGPEQEGSSRNSNRVLFSTEHSSPYPISALAYFFQTGVTELSDIRKTSQTTISAEVTKSCQEHKF